MADSYVYSVKNRIFLIIICAKINTYNFLLYVKIELEKVNIRFNFEINANYKISDKKSQSGLSIQSTALTMQWSK